MTPLSLLVTLKEILKVQLGSLLRAGYQSAMPVSFSVSVNVYVTHIYKSS